MPTEDFTGGRGQRHVQVRAAVSETVFSHASKLALIEEAQAQGFFVRLLVVALDQPQAWA